MATDIQADRLFAILTTTSLIWRASETLDRALNCPGNSPEPAVYCVSTQVWSSEASSTRWYDWIALIHFWKDALLDLSEVVWSDGALIAIPNQMILHHAQLPKATSDQSLSDGVFDRGLVNGGGL